MIADRACRRGSAREPSAGRSPGALVFAALLVLAACAPAPRDIQVEPYPQVEYWQAFALRFGKSAVLPDGLVVTFADVPDDSRCPRGAQCVHAGSAAVLLTFWTNDGQSDSLTLVFGPGSPTRGLSFDREVELRRLLPEPVEGVALEPGSYIASLAIGKY